MDVLSLNALSVNVNASDLLEFTEHHLLKCVVEVYFGTPCVFKVIGRRPQEIILRSQKIILVKIFCFFLFSKIWKFILGHPVF